MTHRARASTRPAPFAALALAAISLAVSACGGVQPGHPHAASASASNPGAKTYSSGGAAATKSSPAPSGPGAAGKPGTSSGSGTSGSTTAKAPSADPHGVVAKIDVSSDRIISEGKIRIAAGAPSDAEVKREIEAARKAGINLPTGESAQAFEAAGQQSSGPAAGATTPVTPWNPRNKPIADWIVPILQWASEHGWHGTVTSGFRTFYEQAQLNAAGAFSAPAGLSNHETTAYPGGAVDVTAPGQLQSVLQGYPGEPKLIGGVLGPADPEHFSATGD